MVNKLSTYNLTHRPRRLRRTPALRAMVRETHLQKEQLIQPIFVKAGQGIHQAVTSMPGMYQFSLDTLAQEIEEIVSLGLSHVLIFGVPQEKDDIGSASWQAQGIVQQAIRLCKQVAPQLTVIADCCFCEYTAHGHCGMVVKQHDVPDLDNDQTLALLAKQAISLAKAGADIIAPSGMIDGMVEVIRESLDAQGFAHVPVMSYAVKYASSFYGPFREATEGAPQFGDRKSYQMDPANKLEALREAALDVEQGADFLMVKPAMPYLDIVYAVKQTYPEVPLVAYQVSGEYAMIKAAAANGWLDEKQVMLESLLSIKRAGADIIITYFAKDFARLYPSHLKMRRL